MTLQFSFDTQDRKEIELCYNLMENIASQNDIEVKSIKLEKDIKDYLESNEKLNVQLEEANKEKENKDSTISTLNNELTEVTQKLNDMKSDYEDVIKSKDAEIQKLQKLRTEKENELHKKVRELEQVVTERDDKQLEITKLTRERNGISDQLTAKNNDYNRLQDDFKSKVKELQEQLDSYGLYKQDGATYFKIEDGHLKNGYSNKCHYRATQNNDGHYKYNYNITRGCVEALGDVQNILDPFCDIISKDEDPNDILLNCNGEATIENGVLSITKKARISLIHK